MRMPRPFVPKTVLWLGRPHGLITQKLYTLAFNLPDDHHLCEHSLELVFERAVIDGPHKANVLAISAVQRLFWPSPEDHRTTKYQDAISVLVDQWNVQPFESKL